MDLMSIPRSALKVPGQALRLPWELAGRLTGGTDGQTAEESLRAMVNDALGRAKEVVGSALGNDALVADGKLQRRRAAKLREAVTLEVQAEHEETSAQESFAQRRQEVAQQRTEAQGATAKQKGRLERERVEATVEGARREQEIDRQRSGAEAAVDNEVESRQSVVERQGEARSAVADQQEQLARRERDRAMSQAQQDRAAAEEARREAQRLGEPESDS